MHKEMNAVKGGSAMIQAYWASVRAVPPKLLKNKDNAMAAQLGGSMARQQANNVLQGGAVKMTSLAGAIFNNKDNKKGQQDTFHWFLECKLGYIITFPRMCTICYGSHCEAAGALILYLPLFIEFLNWFRTKRSQDPSIIWRRIYMRPYKIIPKLQSYVFLHYMLSQSVTLA